ncbi:BnaC04g19750D [Brassica napus]|uniref:BnaC04g19750D protein n=1 Tax=Brassica napus TaxID=3708 RepID=A0A078F5J8_BRANA|nr:BnaC04g19750D [Brassica napus]
MVMVLQSKRCWIRPKIFSVSGWLSFFWKHVDTTLIEVLQALIYTTIMSFFPFFLFVCVNLHCF